MYDYYESEERKMMKGTLRDWRKALRTPATYRVGNTVRIQPQFVLLVSLIGVFLLILFYYNWWTAKQVDVTHRWSPIVRPYNATYPLTPVLISGDVRTYRIGIVADLDTNSKSKSKAHTYNSYLKRGSLSYNPVKNYVSVTWDTQPATLLSSTYAQKGRGMELSELIVYDGRLLTFDDRSGVTITKTPCIDTLSLIAQRVAEVHKIDLILSDEYQVFEIINNKVVPWVVLSDGSGLMEKGFKTEWATIKDEILYVGSMGKEWTTASGEFQTYDPMWVKAVNMNGEVQHLSWVNQYKAVRMSIGIKWPGYMIHESGVWSPIQEKWHFLPRRCSHEPYNETRDEVMGCNYLITADANFHQIQASEVTKHQPKLGFSSFKFIPGSRDEAIVALKTTEFEGKTATYITAFKTDGTQLMVDTIIENLKYEGIEFI